MIEYKIYSSSRVDRMETEISKMLNDGWSLEGSVFIGQTGQMAQALTREVKETVRKNASKKEVSE